MTREAFEALLFVDVADRARAEPGPLPGPHSEHGRAWRRLRDEMLAKGASIVGNLPPARISSYYDSTGAAAEGGLRGAFQSLFGHK